MVSENIQKLYEHINNELIPKYEELEYCKMYKLPEQLKEEVEFIIKINENIDKDDFDRVNYLFERDILNAAAGIFDIPSWDYIYVLSRY